MGRRAGKCGKHRLPLPGFLDRIPLVEQEIPDRVSQIGVIVDHQNPLRHPFESLPIFCRFARIWRVVS